MSFPYRYKIVLAYDGTRYVGWQVQLQQLSIQSFVQKALEVILRHPICLTGAGRTDAGVHAKGQTAHFDTSLLLDFRRFLLSVNALLPPDIRVLSIESVSLSFHARYTATSKIYHYHFSIGTTPSPFDRLYRTHIYKRLHLDPMQEGCRYLQGTHNFASFANHKVDAPFDTVRTLYRVELVEETGGFRFEFEGNGFLYKMARNLAGALFQVGLGKIQPQQLPPLLATCDRKQAPSTAPPHGLCLMKVVYPNASEEIFSKEEKCRTPSPTALSKG